MYSGRHMAIGLIGLFSKMFKKNYIVEGDINGYRVLAEWWIFKWSVKKCDTLCSAMDHLRSITKP